MAVHQTARITASSVNALAAGEILRDIEVRGFGARRRKGPPSYFLQTRVNGRLRWITIGKHSSPWTPSTARREALRLLNEIADGVDPGLERRASRAVPTVAEAAKDFMESHGAKLKASTRTEYDRLLRNAILPAFGRRTIDDIARNDITRFHNALSETPRKANFALAVLSIMMSWCEEEGLRARGTNPCRQIRKYREVARQRFLSDEELERLGRVLQELEQAGEESPYAIAAIRLLLLTGARLGEILSLEWRFVDLQRGLLALPDSKTGQKAIFLNEAAVNLLLLLPRETANPFVIVGARPSSHLINLQKPWRRIRERAGLGDVRIHDLRHSFASIAAAQGASLQLIGRLLGHTTPQTTQRYAHLVADQVRETNESVGAKVGAFLVQPRGQ